MVRTRAQMRAHRVRSPSMLSVAAIQHTYPDNVIVSPSATGLGTHLRWVYPPEEGHTEGGQAQGVAPAPTITAEEFEDGRKSTLVYLPSSKQKAVMASIPDHQTTPKAKVKAPRTPQRCEHYDPGSVILTPKRPTIRVFSLSNFQEWDEGASEDSSESSYSDDMEQDSDLCSDCRWEEEDHSEAAEMVGDDGVLAFVVMVPQTLLKPIPGATLLPETAPLHMRSVMMKYVMKEVFRQRRVLAHKMQEHEASVRAGRSLLEDIQQGRNGNDILLKHPRAVKRALSSNKVPIIIETTGSDHVGAGGDACNSGNTVVERSRSDVLTEVDVDTRVVKRPFSDLAKAMAQGCGRRYQKNGKWVTELADGTEIPEVVPPKFEERVKAISRRYPF